MTNVELLDDRMMEEILGSLQDLGSAPKENATMGSLSNVGPQPARTDTYIEITEQPKQRDHRFRYPVEGRQAGSIAGERSTSDRPSFPTIKLHNLACRAKVVASLVTKDEPPRPHPHRLVGEHCKDGVCTMFINPGDSMAIFRKIGVQRTMNKEVENTLKEREKAGVRLSMEVNKGKSGRKHNYDMKAVRLFFEVYLDDSHGKLTYLPPGVSNPVYDKKDTILQISRVNIKFGCVNGGDELFILCDKVQADDIKVKFSGVDPHNGKWDAFGIFGPNDVHRQFAIVCKTPAFGNQDIKQPVTVMFKLYRPSDEESSNEMEFTYKPLEKDIGNIDKKRRKVSHNKDFTKFFTSTTGKPVKTETFGANTQTCSGAPVTTPVSNAAATLTLSPGMPTSSNSVRQNLRRTLLDRGADPSGRSSRPNTPSGVHFSGGTAQVVDMETTVMTTYSSDAHMSIGHMIQQQPVSEDTGQYNLVDSSSIPVRAFLQALATNSPLDTASETSQSPDAVMDEERQTSEQRINAIVSELMSVENSRAMDGFSQSRVVVEAEPSSVLTDVAFSSLNTIDLAAIQEVQSSEYTFTFPVTFSMHGDDLTDMNNSSDP